MQSDGNRLLARFMPAARTLRTSLQRGAQSSVLHRRRTVVCAYGTASHRSAYRLSHKLQNGFTQRRRGRHLPFSTLYMNLRGTLADSPGIALERRVSPGENAAD